CAEEAITEESQLEPGCDPHVTDAEAGREGVGRFVLPAALEVETEVFDHFRAELQLFLFGVLLVEDGIINLPSTLSDRPNEFDLDGTKRAKDGLDFDRLHPRLVGVEQWVVHVIIGGTEGGVFLLPSDGAP